MARLPALTNLVMFRFAQYWVDGITSTPRHKAKSMMPVILSLLQFLGLERLEVTATFDERKRHVFIKRRLCRSVHGLGRVFRLDCHPGLFDHGLRDAYAIP